MPLKQGSDPKTISANISELTHHGSRPRSHKQIVAIALANAHRAPKRASGGLADYPNAAVDTAAPDFAGLDFFTPIPGTNNLPYAIQMKAIEAAQKAQQLPPIPGASPAGPITPFGAAPLDKDPENPSDTAASFASGGNLKLSGGVSGALKLRPPRSLARISEPKAKGGFIHSSIPGRTDRLAMNVRRGSHVIPADVVSSLGQGNSLAGARSLDTLIRALPQVFAKGGTVSPSPPSRANDHEPILAAGGEYIIEPEEVARVGDGDHDKGHKRLDKMIVNVRRREAKRMLKLPPPKK